ATAHQAGRAVRVAGPAHLPQRALRGAAAAAVHVGLGPVLRLVVARDRRTLRRGAAHARAAITARRAAFAVRAALAAGHARPTALGVGLGPVLGAVLARRHGALHGRLRAHG